MDREAWAHFLEQGQNVFGRIAHLKIPTVAAIHGACLGGGCELALACTCRIATSDHATKIGLPETRLGILPAWGGSTRLPRLIGVLRALKIILAGQTPSAKQALRYGMIDAIAPRELLLSAALRMLTHGRPRRRGWMLNPLVNRLIARIIAPSVRKKLDACARPLSSPDESRRSRARLDVFHRNGIARPRTESPARAGRDRYLQESHPAVFHERTRAENGRPQGAAHRARRRDRRGRDGLRHRGMAGGSRRARDPARHRIPSSWPGARAHPQALQQPARLHGKRGTRRDGPHFSRHRRCPARPGAARDRGRGGNHRGQKGDFPALDRQARRADTILATNTSALSLAEIAGATKNPARVVGIHYFNPVHKMQLVEVVAGTQTAPEVGAARRSIRAADRQASGRGQGQPRLSRQPRCSCPICSRPDYCTRLARGPRTSTRRCSTSACRWGRCG